MLFPICTAAEPSLALDLSVSYGEGDTFAIPKGKKATLRLRCARRISSDAPMLHLRKDGDSRACLHLSFAWTGSCESEDLYTCALSTEALVPGLYFFDLTLSSPDGNYHSCYRDGNAFWQKGGSADSFQLTVYERIHPSISWLEGGIIYHVFVDRFARGAKTMPDAPARFNKDWDGGRVEYPPYPGAPFANNTHFGGNLAGIIDRLPYLESLGVSCLYLSPIGRSASNHKYDTGDYLSVDPSFGDRSTLEKLIKKAKRCGIGIILDGVFNHTGDDSVYFNRYGRYDSCGAYQSKESPYYDWYTFTSHPNSYLSWWDISILPKLNLSNSSCRDYLVGKGGVVDSYAAMGIAGMRLDVADELDDRFIATVKERLCEHKKDAVLYGEVWEDASCKIAYSVRKQYYLGTELDGVMNYPVRTGILSFIKDGDVAPLRYALDCVQKNAPSEVLAVQMNLLGTHDTERVLSALGDISFEGMTNDRIANVRMDASAYETAKQKLKLAYLICATVPGVPSIYYGDEVGMEGYKDPFNRAPFPWNDMDTDLLEFYRSVGALRRSEKAYRNGEFALHMLTDSVLIFSRKSGSRRIFTLINRGPSSVSILSDARIRYHYRTDSNVSDKNVVCPWQGVVFSTRSDKLGIKSL